MNVSIWSAKFGTSPSAVSVWTRTSALPLLTASLQNTLWNRHCLLEKSRTDFLIAQDSARQDLIAVEEALSVQVDKDELVPDGADYAGNGCWRYRGFTIQAIEQESHLDGQRFQFVAVAKAQNLQFPQLMQAGIWLDGVRHGMDHLGDKPVMVCRPYQTEATPVDDATDLTVAT